MDLVKFSPQSFLGDHQKLKSYLLILSCICLFVSLTKSLPSEISVIGLKIPKDSVVSGWFLFSVTFYFFIKYAFAVAFSALLYFYPSWVVRQLNKIECDEMGLSLGELCEMEAASESEELYHLEGEHGSMSCAREVLKRKEELKAKSLNAKPGHYWYWFVFWVDGVFPLLLGLSGLYMLLGFLWR